jgi:hypothetical protein
MFLLLMAVAALQATPTANQHPPVCIGKMLDECLGSLRAHFKLDEDQVSFAKKAVEEVDLNGRHMYDQRIANFRASPVGSEGWADVEIRFNAQGAVRQINFDLLLDPLTAETAEQYDRTGLYGFTAAMIGGTGCAQDDRLSWYRFFQNVVKPSIRTTRDGDEELKNSSTFTLCGYGFKYHAFFTESVSSVTLDNPHGLLSSYELIFMAPSSAPPAGAPPPKRLPGRRR